MTLVIVVNYADEKYQRWQKLTTESAYRFGADKVMEYSPADLSEEFCKTHRHILEQKRGVGYWIWKPYIIKDALLKTNANDILVYIDSGICVVNDLYYLIDAMEKTKTEIAVFECEHIEKTWTKRDAFILMDCDSPEYTETQQRGACFIILKNSEKSIEFIEEWQKYMVDERIVTDIPNRLGKKNYDTFKENRYDQTVLSLLSKKWKLPSFRLPNCPPMPHMKSKYAEGVYERSQYPMIIVILKHIKPSRDISLDEALEVYAPHLTPFYLIKTAFMLWIDGMTHEAIMLLIRLRSMDNFRKVQWQRGLGYLISLLNQTETGDIATRDMMRSVIYDIMLDYIEDGTEAELIAILLPLMEYLSYKEPRTKTENSFFNKLNQYIRLVAKQKDKLNPETNQSVELILDYAAKHDIQ